MGEVGGAHASLDSLHDPPLLDEDERGHGLDPKAAGQIGVQVNVYLQHAQVSPLFSRDVRHQAVHPPSGPRTHGREEDEYR